MKYLILIFLAISVYMNLPGQSLMLDSVDFENVIQKLLPQQEFDADYNDIYDRLFSLYITPLDLNKASRNQFQSLYILTDNQIEGILEYRQKFGDFKSIFELTTIEGFDTDIVGRLQSFVMIHDKTTIKLREALKEPAINELFLRYQTVLEAKRGYSSPDTLSNGQLSSRYAGDPGRLYARYLYAKPGKFSFGFTAEKDPGEKLIWDNETRRYGIDYYNFHAALEKVWIFDKIIFGDYNLDFGQGLVFGSGINIGKGTQPITSIRRNNLGLQPYRSVFEGKDFSGVAFSIESGSIGASFFLSRVHRDARIISSDHTEEMHESFTNNISSVGLHRTPSEIDAKHKLIDQSVGGNISAKFLHDKLEVGINAMFCNYNLDIKPNPDLYKIFQFNRSSNFNASSYVNYYFKNGHLFSELAFSKGGGIAQSTGLIISLSSYVQTSVHYRNYSVNYHNLIGNAFGENSRSNNEKGIFWGINIVPSNKLLISGYFDYFSFPWLKYRVDGPTTGWDNMIAMQYAVNNRSALRFQFRNKIKSYNQMIDGEPMPDIIPKNTMRMMADLNYTLDENFSFRTWLQHTIVKDNYAHKTGFLIAQDISYSTKKIALDARFSIFDSDDYDSRMYLYEKDLLYVFRVPSFYDQGLNYFVLLKYKFNSNITAWFKYSKIYFFNADTIGSGLEEIQGNTKTNISLQLRIKL